MKQINKKTHTFFFFTVLFFASQACLSQIDDKFQKILSLSIETSSIYIGAAMGGNIQLTNTEAKKAQQQTLMLNELSKEYLAEISKSAKGNCKKAISALTNETIKELTPNLSKADYFKNFIESGAMDDAGQFTEQLTYVAYDACAQQ